MGDREGGNLFSLGIKHPLQSYHKSLCCERPRHIWRLGWNETLYDFRLAGYSIPFNLSPAITLHLFLSPGNEIQVKVLGQVHSVDAMRGHPSRYLGGENTWEGCDRRLRFYFFITISVFFSSPYFSLPSSNVN